MILDRHLTHPQKIIIAIATAAVWIYFRTFDCYKLLKRKSLLSIVLVVAWIYLYDKDPLFLPIGLAIMYSYSLIPTSRS